MITCESCQPLLLPYLFELVDDAERQAIDAHLGNCPQCRAALDKAGYQRQIIAAAAKSEFPDVRFQPAAKAGTKQTVARPRRSIGRWAVAASLLLALASAAFTAVSWYGHSRAADRARAELDEAQSVRDRRLKEHLAEAEALQADIARVQKQIDAVEAQYRDELTKVQREYDSKPVLFTVIHPKTLQAGGANQLTIQAKRKPGAKAENLQLVALVIDDKTKAELARKTLLDGQNDFVLPANLPLKPGTQLSLHVLAIQPGQGEQTLLDEVLPLVTSLYVTHLTTARPLYRPGETVYFRSLTLERFSLTPADEDFVLQFRLVRVMGGQEQNVEVLDPATGQPAQLIGAAKLKDKDGAPLLGPDGNPLRGIGGGSFVLPGDLAGGEYTLIVSDAYDRFPTEKRKIIVNRYQAPRLYKDVDFTRKSYGPGDVVTATCKVSPVEGGRVLANMPVTATAEVDGLPCEMLTKGALKTNEIGQCIVQFKLPAKIERGEGVLTVAFSDGGNVETTVEPIPIVISKLKVDFYPEGGEMIAGVKNHIYFQAKTPLGKPAELRGRIVDQDGKEVATLKTFSDDKDIGVNQGMGRFDFTPTAGERYELKIDAPEGIEGRFWLPPLQNDGVVLHLPKGVVTTQIDVVLTSPGKTRKLLVGAYCRGQLLDHRMVTVEAGRPQTVLLKPAAEVGGVLRVTVFEMAEGNELDLRPVAERLLYRHSPEKLDLQIFTDKKTYTPGDRVTLSLKATDQHNKPAPAVVLVSVVDKSILKLRNDRTARALPTHFLLTSEVRGPEDLEYADFLLLEKSKDGLGLDVAKAHTALDLLLGTQGWRRFVEQKLPGERAKTLTVFKSDTDRLLAVNGQGPQQQKQELPLNAKAIELVSATALKHEKLEKQLGGAEAMQERKLQAGQKEREELLAAVRNKEAEVFDAERQLRMFGEWLYVISWTVAFGGVALAAVVLVVIGFVRVGQKRPYAGACFVAGVCCFICLVAGGTMWQAQPERVREASARVQVLAGAMVIDEAAAKVRGGDKDKDRDKDKADEKDVLAVEMNPRFEGFSKGLKAKAGGGGAFGGGGKGFGGGAGLPKSPAAPGMDQPLPNIKVIIIHNVDPAVVQRALDAIEGLKAEPKFAGAKADAAKDVVAGENGVLQKKGKLAARVDRDLKEAEKKDHEWLLRDLLPKLDPMEVGGGKRFEPALVKQIDEELRKNGKFLDLTKRRLLLQEQQLGLDAVSKDLKVALATADAFVVRQYAHQHKTSDDNVRRDFAETLYWHPALVVPGDKGVDFNFDLSDAVTQFQVQVWGHTLDGRLAATTKDIAARLPFSLDAKLPIEISSTDKVAIPVAFSNDTDKNRNVKLNVEAVGLKLDGEAEQLLPLGPNSRVRKVLKLQPSIVQGEAKLRLFGLCDPFGSDSIERAFKIVPEGFPVSGKLSGTLKGTATHTVQLPARRDQWVPGTLKLTAQAFPSTLADLQKGLEALLREPGGCFEQTSSSNYPNIMILDYLKESGQIQPQLEKKARALLENGYGRLIVFECIDPATKEKKQGYEWFGQTAPPHEALTAYGLLQFLDMAKYQPVDQAMIERTKAYLLGQRDGKGGFKRNGRALDSFGRAPDHITNGYIVWALCEAEVKENIRLELETAVAQATRSEDPYLLALAGLSLLKRGQSLEALPLLKKLQAKQQKDGSLLAKETSITHSGGAQLTIETTSLAILAWLRAGERVEFGDNVRQAADWIGKQRGAFGGYGSTQSTILALKALIAYTRENKKTAEAGELRLYVNGQAEPVAVKAFPAGTVDPLIVELTDDKLLQPGDNTIRVEITGNNAFPHTVTWSYMALTPANKEACPVRLITKLAAATATEGQSLRVTAILENASGQEQGMAVAIVGLPGGCLLPADLQELRNLVKAGKIDAFEIRGRDLVLYWRGLAKDAKHEVNFNIICQVPGEYRGPASRAYLYYNTDERWWVPPLAVEIRPE